MFDDFQRADGSITGSVADPGGTWATEPNGGYVPMVVASLAAEGQSGFSASGNVITDALTVPQLAGPWWCRYTFGPGAQPAQPMLSGVWIGDDVDNVFFGVLQSYGSGSPSPGNAEFLAGNVQAAEIDVTVAIDPALSHEVVFQWDGAGNIELLLDDVSIGTASGVTIDPGVVRRFEIYQNCTGGSPPWPIGLVELGVGTYPG